MKKVKQGKVYNYRAVVRGYQKESRQAVYTEFELTWDHLDDCTWWPIRQR
jgi:hypothetical protein